MQQQRDAGEADRRQHRQLRVLHGLGEPGLRGDSEEVARVEPAEEQDQQGPSQGRRVADADEYPLGPVLQPPRRESEEQVREDDSREEVDEAYERCLQIGANIHFPPQEDRDEPGYWALFVFDPDGIRLEVAHWPRAEF